MGATLFALRSNWNSLPPVWVRGAIWETPNSSSHSDVKKPGGSSTSDSGSGQVQHFSAWFTAEFSMARAEGPKAAENAKPNLFFEILEGISSKFLRGSEP